MKLPPPSHFHHALSEDRLQTIAARLLEVRHSTGRELNTDLDDDYVRETAAFGRSRNMLIGMALNSQYPWLKLTHAGFDVTAEIEGIPFRFFRDDPDHPCKDGFFKRNAVDALFAVEDVAPVMWRFVIERSTGEDGEDQVHFIGYNIYADKVAQWTLQTGAAGTLAGVDRDVPPAKVLALPVVELLRDDGEQSEEKAS